MCDDPLKPFPAQKALLLDDEDDDGERSTRKNRVLAGDKYSADLPTRAPKKKLTPEEKEELLKKVGHVNAF